MWLCNIAQFLIFFIKFFKKLKILLLKPEKGNLEKKIAFHADFIKKKNTVDGAIYVQKQKKLY